MSGCRRKNYNGNNMPLSSTSAGFEINNARRELAAGLLHAQPRIAPKYFYDALGSKLFEAICQLDEYYLTRTEAAIFRDFAGQIAQAAGQGATLIDLGAGNCEKAAGLFGTLQPSRYVPVDISASFLTDAVENLRKKFPHIPMHPVGMDFSEHFSLPPAARGGVANLFFYPGSSLGNFGPAAAAQFLHRLRAACGDEPGAVLIGVDLVKSTETLTAAYDDALGVTAAFNLNILRHVNRLLGSDFDTRDFAHVALYNTAQSRIEMHLRARHDITVRWPGAARHFAQGERIHTENSYKFTRRGLVDLLAQTGFGEPTCWTDPAEQFLLCHARKI
jgi:dimethylhistidine N-methyltransferase